jgi:hypothetical protein
VKYGGLKPWQALETVTYLPAKAYGLSEDLGTLEPGRLADLIIVSGNPLENIDDAARVECVAKNGKLQSVSPVMAPFGKSTIGEDICPTHQSSCYAYPDGDGSRCKLRVTAGASFRLRWSGIFLRGR